MKKNILVLCVTYNSNNELNNYLDSINAALMYSSNYFNVDVYIADNNSENNFLIRHEDYNCINVHYHKNDQNLGYLGGVRSLINSKLKANIFKYDFLIISNVDLLVSENFFSELYNLKVDSLTAWIAPSIFSSNEKRDKNPKIMSRPSRKKFLFYLIKYRFPIVNFLYDKSFYKLKFLKRKQNTSKQIYAGHGSFMIFTNVFILDIANMVFPSFLFGEEIFIAEHVIKSNLKVIYEPSISIIDIEHASTGKFNYFHYCKSNYDSLRKLKMFFNE